MNKINKVPHSHTGNYSIKANHKNSLFYQGVGTWNICKLYEYILLQLL